MVKLFDELAGQGLASGQAEPDARPALPALLTFLAAAAIGFAALVLFDLDRLDSHRQQEAQIVSEKLIKLKGKLVAVLDQRLFLAPGLEALIRNQPGISQHEFQHVASMLLAGKTGIRAILLARDNVVSHAFPGEAGRTAMGTSLLTSPEQAAAVREAVTRKTTVLAGPFTLVQGGAALAARQPIFPSGPTGDYWGMASIIIEADNLFDEAGFRIASDREGIRVAVRGKDGKGAGGGMVWGDPTLFQEHPIGLDMDVPGGSWRLAAVPLQGWSPDYPNRLMLWSLGSGLIVGLAALAAFLSVFAKRLLTQAQGRADVKRELTESEERFRRLAEAAWEGLVIHDRQHIYDFNTRLVEMTGYSPEEIRRMSLFDLIAPADRDRLGGLESGQHEFKLKCKSGEAIVVESRSADLFFRGRVLHVASLRDITQTKEAERALVTARDAAEMANRVKSEFLANMSHELRTPLNAVIGFSEIMEQELLGPIGTPRYKTYVRDIQVSAHHLLDIINDILDISRVEAGTMGLFETSFNPGIIARSSLRLLEARATKNKCKLKLDLPEETLPNVLGDERRLKQVLLNLLSNAVKFTGEGGVVSLRLRLVEGEGMLFEVADTGIGMSQEDIKKALTPFVQIDSGMNRRQEGTGLGLPLAKNMIEMHGSQLIVESQPGKGTRVAFVLPLWRISPPQTPPPSPEIPLKS